MICLTEMLGRPVISARTGDRLGRVSQVVLDLVGRRIVGFRLRHGGLLDRRWRLAALQDLSAISPETVVVPDDMALREDEQGESRLPLGGRPMTVVDSDGVEMGRLTDVAAELGTGDLIDLLVTPTRARARPSAAPIVVPVERVSRCRGRAIVLEETNQPAHRARELAPAARCSA